MPEGTVISYNAVGGFGFADTDGSPPERVFFHASQLPRPWRHRHLEPGTRLSFQEIVPGRKCREAIGCEVLGGGAK